ncbi:MAG: hypothetical protein QOG67_1504 [Verrucomicrobiota bacterium]|jgi:hypothetical protein
MITNRVMLLPLNGGRLPMDGPEAFGVERVLAADLSASEVQVGTALRAVRAIAYLD